MFITPDDVRSGRVVRKIRAQQIAAAPFPSNSAADRRVKEALRRQAVATGKRKPTKADLAREAKAADQRRGWRVVVGSAFQDVNVILSFDPGARGGHAAWRRDSDQWTFFAAGDGAGASPQMGLDWVVGEALGQTTRWPLIVLEDQTGFRHTGKRGTNVSEHTAGRNWGQAAGQLELVCRRRGWPMVYVQARTWQSALHPLSMRMHTAAFEGESTLKGAKLHSAAALLVLLGGARYSPFSLLPPDFYGPVLGKNPKDGRVDAACIGAWAATTPGVLDAIIAACREAQP
jgi:hypothetical protein